MNDEPPIIGAWDNRKNIIIITLIVVVLLLGGFAVWLGVALQNNNAVQSTTSGNVSVSNSNSSGTTPTAVQSIPKVGVITQTEVPVQDMASAEVDVTSVGFSPSSITISEGQSVIWTVRGGSPDWIVSNPSDPYPVKGTCGSLFNSCSALKLGDSFRMVFNDPGTWTYYDKLDPSFVGTVIVQ